MFNLKDRNQVEFSERHLLRSELSSFNIFPRDGGKYDLSIGDEHFHGLSLQECGAMISEAVAELKQELRGEWDDLASIARIIAQNKDGNPGTLDNVYFLVSVKRAYAISKRFSQLQEVTASIQSLFDVDVSEVNGELIGEFNYAYLKVRLLHKLVMGELYRLKLIEKYSKMVRSAQVSGPWSNLDLPMKERVWEWSEEEQEEGLREKAKKEQPRYNPEYNKEGFYFVWQDYSRDPYRFEDRDEDSPYKGRNQLAIP